MRPVNKGKNSKKFSDYPYARGDLIDRLGEYCSYCERKLPAALAVEHVQPKAHHPKLRLKWDNFLLACTNCNSTKSDQDVELDDYLWPDKDNTFRAFSYRAEGIITVNNELTKRQRALAQKTLDLTGLQKHPGGKDYKRSDRRWSNRRETWEIASRSLRNLLNNDTDELREQIVETAYLGGFWSVWMTVFKEDSDILNRLIKRFPGTSKPCFQKSGKPIARKGGQV